MKKSTVFYAVLILLIGLSSSCKQSAKQESQDDKAVTKSLSLEGEKWSVQMAESIKHRFPE
ncbi:MAG: hypothetical protein VX319_11080, partial [Bacteroidota bacterium]|nr:hypothetical protein [Bacteroidota bacterium]